MKLRDWLWPVMPVEEPWPERKRNESSGTNIVYEHARDLVSRQGATFDAIDAKAATIIGAILVVLGLVLPNVRAKELPHWIALGAFLLVIGYGLAAAFAAYGPTKLKIGVQPSTLTPAMTKTEEAARIAVALHLLRKYVQNEPAVQRKAAFVLRGLIALAVAIVPLFALSLLGALR